MGQSAPLPHMVVNINNQSVAFIRQGFRDAQEADKYVKRLQSKWSKPRGQDFEIYPDTTEARAHILKSSII